MTAPGSPPAAPHAEQTDKTEQKDREGAVEKHDPCETSSETARWTQRSPLSHLLRKCQQEPMWLRIDSIKQSPGLFDPKGGAKSLVQLRKAVLTCLSLWESNCPGDSLIR